MENDPVEIKFKFPNRENIILIQTTRQEKIENVFQKLEQKTKENINCYFFLYSGKLVDKNLTVYQINKNDKSFQILASPYGEIINGEICKKSKYIICPKCERNSIIKFDNYKISLEECDNNHKTSNIFFEDFEKTQLINQSKIKCEKCDKTYSMVNEFYKCFTCNQNLCPNCKKGHENHSIANYDLINYVCNEHKIKYEYYCQNCHKNICSNCKTKHKEHNLINFDNYIIEDNIDEEEYTTIFSVFKNEINGIKNMLDIIVKNIELYNKIINEIKDNNDNNINYQIYQNINNKKNFKKDIIEEMKEIIFEKEINQKIYKLFQIYNKMVKRDKIQDSFGKNELIKFDNKKFTEINIEYKNNNDSQIQLFGEEFIINNKDKCLMKYNDKSYNLEKSYKRSLLKINGKKFVVQLQISNEITDLSCMFKNCSSLIELKNINKLKTEKITNMSYMFYGCTSLIYFPGISDWKTSNVTNMSYMFYNCSALESLPNISKWNTQNVTNMDFMFYNCKNLKSFPEIGKWNTNKMNGAFFMFIGCNSNILPDISNWNNKNENENKDKNKEIDISIKQTNIQNQNQIIMPFPFDIYQNNQFNNYNNVMLSPMKDSEKMNINNNNLNNNINNNFINNNNYIKNTNKNTNNINTKILKNDNDMTAGPLSNDIKIINNNENGKNLKINVNKKDIKKDQNKKKEKITNNPKHANNRNKSTKEINTKYDFVLIGIIPGIKKDNNEIKKCNTLSSKFIEDMEKDDKIKRTKSGKIRLIKK